MRSHVWDRYPEQVLLEGTQTDGARGHAVALDLVTVNSAALAAIGKYAVERTKLGSAVAAKAVVHSVHDLAVLLCEIAKLIGGLWVSRGYRYAEPLLFLDQPFAFRGIE